MVELDIYIQVSAESIKKISPSGCIIKINARRIRRSVKPNCNFHLSGKIEKKIRAVNVNHNIGSPAGNSFPCEIIEFKFPAA